MNKAELIEALADKAGLQKQKAKKVLDAYIEIVTEKMSQKEEITLIGFGTLIPRPQTSRLARNPKTGTPVQIPARTTVKFKPGKFLLEAMNGTGEKNNMIYFFNFLLASAGRKFLHLLFLFTLSYLQNTYRNPLKGVFLMNIETARF